MCAENGLKLATLATTAAGTSTAAATTAAITSNAAAAATALFPAAIAIDSSPDTTTTSTTIAASTAAFDVDAGISVEKSIPGADNDSDDDFPDMLLYRNFLRSEPPITTTELSASTTKTLSTSSSLLSTTKIIDFESNSDDDFPDMHLYRDFHTPDPLDTSIDLEQSKILTPQNNTIPHSSFMSQEPYFRTKTTVDIGTSPFKSPLKSSTPKKCEMSTSPLVKGEETFIHSLSQSIMQPLSTTEDKLTTHLVKRKLNTGTDADKSTLMIKNKRSASLF
ncbi:hypothetical protein PoB_005471600 [Plakobranchus ocellatus]|uniref:Uncharacterized protein n=1 Tax=Plakobranchus ocellatus TaxID=259542 RepID=A0AAV4BYJ3_9GAST|nr:hypothetical protein PoB_005471600 [Plakobranchus ocellatus]